MLAARQAVIDAIDRTTARIEFAPDGTVVFANECFLAAMKYRSEEGLGQNHRMFCDEACANSSDYIAHWQRLRRAEPVSGRFQRRNASSAPVWLEVSCNPVFDESGRPCKFIKPASDISSRVEALEEEFATAAIEAARARPARSSTASTTALPRSSA